MELPDQRAVLGLKLLNAIRPPGLQSVAKNDSTPDSAVAKIQESIESLKALTITNDATINPNHSMDLNVMGKIDADSSGSFPFGTFPSTVHPTRWGEFGQSNTLYGGNAPLGSRIGGVEVGLYPHKIPPGLVNGPPGFDGRRHGATRPPPGLTPSLGSFPSEAPPYGFPLGESTSHLLANLQPSSLFQISNQQQQHSPMNNFNISKRSQENNITSSDDGPFLNGSLLMKEENQKSSLNSNNIGSQVKDGTSFNDERAKSTALLSMLKSTTGESISKLSVDIKDKSSDIVAVKAADGERDVTEQQGVQTKKTSNIRTTKLQVGQLIIKLRNSKMNTETEMQEGFYMRPGNLMTVVWRVPTSYQQDSSVDLVIGLLRYGSQVNTPSIISKSINAKNSNAGDNCRTGAVQFFAPKAAGQFVFRLFNQATRESSLETVATSVSFSVVLVDSDIISNLQHVMDAFQDQLPVKAINQLNLIVKGIKSCSNTTVKDCAHALNRCIDQLIDEIHATLPVLDEGVKKKQMLKASPPDSSETFGKELEEEGKTESSDKKCPEEEEFWKHFRQALRIHAEAHDTLQALIDRKTPWYLVTEKLKNTIKFIESLFCPILKRYFRNLHEMTTHRISMLEFSPAPMHLSTSMNVLTAMNNQFHRIIPQLLPASDFYSIREKTRDRLEYELTTLNGFPLGTRLAIYGSSANNFGSDGADLDMCIIFPSGLLISAEEKRTFVERIGEVLTKLGMNDVRTRSTARIPIVQFRDQLSGLECDISLHNPLALANTRLLQTYSRIDPRVRQMTYIIKYWAKRRRINSPQDGTLSSYGYILAILHFLQRRPVPLIPNLQDLPPSWPAEFHGVKPVNIDVAADGISCNTYFFQPREDQFHALQNIAAQNKESIAELIFEFFRYYAWHFDFRNTVVSIRSANQMVAKMDKYERDGWFHSDNLSIEDPFEYWYDVAHVIKSSQMTLIRKEFLRAFTLFCRVFDDDAPTDSLPAHIDGEQLIELLFQESETPTFVQSKKG